MTSEASRWFELFKAFGRAPTPEERGRFDLMRLVNHVFTGVIFLTTAAQEHPGVPLTDRGLAGPELAELHALLRTGRFNMLAWDSRITYGKARLAAALEGLRAPACAQALGRLTAD